MTTFKQKAIKALKQMKLKKDVNGLFFTFADQHNQTVHDCIGRIEAIEEDREIIICAAVNRDGKIFKGHRHNDAIFTAINNKCKAPIQTSKQGFITSSNRYVERDEAMLIARNAGQTESTKDELYSEDLY